ncbi:MAG: M20/M25/M40 family metallo-hydrolase [Synergistaceae bacterium]|jgi:arginine utilization protein RocB|nr:M20/M25/M40 family metallo-hydrolase [Synergistaceae bacterium]
MDKLSFVSPSAGSPVLDKMGKRVYDLMLELVAIPSITGSEGGENECARFIRDRLSRCGYFKQNPDDLRLIALENDPWERHFLGALLRSARPSKKTIILMGHFDVVDTDVCGSLRSWAFDPEEYTRRMGGLDLPEEARKDLDSGGYLFGRGVADMKTGLALNICLLEDYAARREELEFNVLLLAVPDEEGDSAGMRGAISFLSRLKEESLDFLACVDTEPAFEGNSPALYYGTIGKIMPMYLCVGKETHGGEYYEGLNSTLVASYLNISLDGGKDTIETLGSETFQPQCCLRMRDLRTRYAVTLPERTFLYYNCLTVKKTPAGILAEMKGKAESAMSSALSHVGRRDWKPRVLTVEEVLDRAARILGGREKLFAELLPQVGAKDERERNVEFLSLALDAAGEKGPLVVVGFVPPFYPPRRNRGESAHERAVRHSASIAEEALKRRGFDLKKIEIFQGITDLSFTGFQGKVEELASLAANTPLWGRGYDLPLPELQKIDIPGVIFGPIGKDAHKITERVELNYSFNVLPSILKEFIESVFRASFLTDDQKPEVRA